ncbi:hypothetical protein KORDIASMS9_04199 [Kordia sp. SMS9]|uniref:nuclear transport factor 2 family protein n=1 Tax=Kordia sp. SMS9 TaxID=2282170 RepID=UPI000E0D9492|nr:DUF4440 domain-containing protein [Kordia sp. SMS9]AXG71941.1 hypothetical protein KORDIASMS9_04199 [Kordia sp. SMS9]
MKNYAMTMLFLGIFFFTNHTLAQTTETGTQNTLEETILALDAQFWNVYNSCDVTNFKKFLTEDLEFYHDKGGLTETSEKLVEMMENGLCADPNMKLRREAVKGTVNVFPLHNYGAIITGEHLFYLTENGTAERLVESAKFTHVWQNENGNWRMSRVLSYDHQETHSNKNRLSVPISIKMAKALVGTYKAPNTGTVSIFMENNELRMKAGEMNAVLHANLDGSFFIKDAPIRISFTKDTKGKATGFTVYENGKAVEKAKRVE